MHKKLLVFVFIFNICQAAEQADAKAGAASEIEKKVDRSLAQELNEREKKELLAAQSILFRLKRINADGTKIGPGLPQRIGTIVLDEFVEEWGEAAASLHYSEDIDRAQLVPGQPRIIVCTKVNENVGYLKVLDLQGKEVDSLIMQGRCFDGELCHFSHS